MPPTLNPTPTPAEAIATARATADTVRELMPALEEPMHRTRQMLTRLEGAIIVHEDVQREMMQEIESLRRGLDDIRRNGFIPEAMRPEYPVSVYTDGPLPPGVSTHEENAALERLLNRHITTSTSTAPADNERGA